MGPPTLPPICHTSDCRNARLATEVVVRRRQRIVPRVREDAADESFVPDLVAALMDAAAQSALRDVVDVRHNLEFADRFHRDRVGTATELAAAKHVPRLQAVDAHIRRRRARATDRELTADRWGERREIREVPPDGGQVSHRPSTNARAAAQPLAQCRGSIAATTTGASDVARSTSVKSARSRAPSVAGTRTSSWARIRRGGPSRRMGPPSGSCANTYWPAAVVRALLTKPVDVLRIMTTHVRDRCAGRRRHSSADRSRRSPGRGRRSAHQQ